MNYKILINLFIIAFFMTFFSINLANGETVFEEIDSEPHWATEADFKKEEPKIINKIKWLEENPNNPSWKKNFKYVMIWASDVPYVHVTFEARYLQELNEEFEAKKSDRKDLNNQKVVAMFLLGNLLYLLENPGSKTDDLSAIKRGFQSMVNVYISIKNKNSNFHYDSLDKYQQLIKSGNIDDYIQKVKEKLE